MRGRMRQAERRLIKNRITIDTWPSFPVAKQAKANYHSNTYPVNLKSSHSQNFKSWTKRVSHNFQKNQLIGIHNYAQMSKNKAVITIETWRWMEKAWFLQKSPFKCEDISKFWRPNLKITLLSSILTRKLFHYHYFLLSNISNLKL